MVQNRAGRQELFKSNGLEFSCACGAKSSHALSVLSEEQQHKKTYTVSPICKKSPDSSMCVSLSDREVASSGVYLA